MTTPLSRPLGFAEELMWRADPVSPLNNCSHLSLHGPVTPAALRQALDILQAAHPLLQMKVSTRLNKAYFVSGAPEIPLETTTGSEADAKARVLAEVERAFDAERGPLVRAVLIAHGNEHFSLLLVLHHAIFDGRASLHFIGACLQHAFAGHPAPESKALIPDFGAFMPADTRGWAGFGKLSAAQQALGAVAKTALMNFKLDESCPLEARRKTITDFAFDRTTSQQILARVEQEKCTPHSFLAAVLARCLRETLGLDAAPLLLASAVDISRKLEKRFASELMIGTSALTCTVDSAIAQSIWQSARTLKADMQRLTREKQYLYLTPVSMKINAAIARIISLGKAGPLRLARLARKFSGDAISHTTLGDIGLATRYGEVEVEAARMFPGFTTMTPILSIAYIFDERIHWNMSGFREQIGAERLEQLKEHCHSTVLALVAAAPESGTA